jgi:hypothetical protein
MGFAPDLIVMKNANALLDAIAFGNPNEPLKPFSVQARTPGIERQDQDPQSCNFDTNHTLT